VTGGLRRRRPANAPAIVELACDAASAGSTWVNNAGHVAVGPISAQSARRAGRAVRVHVIGRSGSFRESVAAAAVARGQVFMLGSGVARVPVRAVLGASAGQSRGALGDRGAAPASCGPEGIRP